MKNYYKEETMEIVDLANRLEHGTQTPEDFKKIKRIGWVSLGLMAVGGVALGKTIGKTINRHQQ